MASATFDKKQLPQVIVMGVLTLGLFGYLASKMIVPQPTQAAAPASVSSKTSLSSGKASSGDHSGTNQSSTGSTTPDGGLDASILIGGNAPSDSMRDPFVALSPILSAAPPAPAPKKVQASAGGSSSIPGLGQIRPLPLPDMQGSGQSGTPPTPVSWQLTGIIQSDTDPSNALAIMRDPSTHKYMRLGDQLDEHTKLIGIDKNSVTLLRSGQRIQLGVSSTILEEQSSGGASAPQQAIPSTPPGYPVASPSTAAPAVQKSENHPAHVEPTHSAATVPHNETYSHGAAD